MELLLFDFYLFSFCFLFCFYVFFVIVFVDFLFIFVFFLLILFFPLYCFSSCCICILLSFCFSPVSENIFFFRRFCFLIWFCILERSQNEGKNEGKIHDKQLGMNLDRSWQTFFPILLLLRQLPLLLRGLIVFLLQAFILPAPVKHQ